MLSSNWVRAQVLSITFAFLAVPSSAARGFEVWLVDQSDSFSKSYGGAIYIYDGERLSGTNPASVSPTDVLDLGGATAQLCLMQTGAYPVRSHMLAFNRTQSHAILTFVASGHVVIFDAAKRTPLACIRTTGTPTGRQAHAAEPTPDDRYIFVANQNGKILDRISTDYTNNRFVLDATLDLANGMTPNGLPMEFVTATGSSARPNNAPIVAVPNSAGNLIFVTLRGGGLFVVDPATMQIVAEYDNLFVRANGFGGIEANGSMYINSGSGGEMTNPSNFTVYRFPVSGYSVMNGPNTPAPREVFSDSALHPGRDAHGLLAVRQNRHIWVLDRSMNVAEVFETSSGGHVNTISLEHRTIAGLTPDLAAVSPDGNLVFVSLRGPNPLSGSPHAATGSVPGVGIIHVSEGGETGVLASVVRIGNKDSSGVERADAHGIGLRLKSEISAAPTAVAGPKDLTTFAIQVQLDGSKSTSTDGKPLTYQWSVAPGSPVPAMSGANTATPTVQFPTGPVAYILELTVTDSTGRTATDNVTVNFARTTF